ncbi:MAG: TIM barrel protein [Bryobacterales bacterium]|nr:TIM barrel protein [Bryobacterales bacterium]
MTRRVFAGTTAAMTTAAAQPPPKKPKLGIDLFSLRSQGWTAFESLDYCARLGAEVCFFSELRFLGGSSPDHLRKVKEHAAKQGIVLELGMTSICPTSTMFKPELGTAEEQIVQAMAAAKALGVSFIRCYQGRGEDRKTPGGLERHAEETLKVLRSVRTRLLDAGLKMAIENHAGDYQARGLRQLLDAAGKDIAGCTLDSGNSTWCLEDPHVTLETLAPYALASGVRDSILWRTAEGIAVRWVRMGEGNVGMEQWVKDFLRLCPGVTLALEIISLPSPRIYKVFDRAFWHGYEDVRANEFVRFLALAEKGQPSAGTPLPKDTPKDLVLAAEREELEASYRWTRGVMEKA